MRDDHLNCELHGQLKVERQLLVVAQLLEPVVRGIVHVV